MDLNEKELITLKINQLKDEHRNLDNIILKIQKNTPFDQLELQRLKKRKLILKDNIMIFENKLIPDIIA